MKKILILFAHPRFEKSRINRGLLDNIGKLAYVTLHDLYEEYPDFNIDADREKSLLLRHSVIVWHHPLYMYGVPALLKQWIDLVLEYGWAHGKNGNNLQGKIIFNALTTGGTRDTYASKGHNGFTIREFLVSFEQTAALCKMVYLPPFVVHGTHRLTKEDVEVHRRHYQTILERLANIEYETNVLQNYEYLNDWLTAGNGEIAK